jgi:hypothetical protein
LLTLVFTTGFIFFYFSELLFWARPRPGDSPGGWLATWMVYSALAFFFLVIVNHFRVRSIWAVFLAGAAFGWLGEGLVVQTAYEQLPLSISFTGLAWHALITVWVGWYAVRKSLHSPDSIAVLKVCALIGLGYGLWAISWWGEPDGGVSTIQEFAAFSFIATTLAIVAYRISDWGSAERFFPNRWPVMIIGGLALLYFLFITIPAQPLAPFILPVLLGLVYLGLRWNRQSEPEGSLLDPSASNVPPWKYATVLAIPVCAVAIYALAMILDLHWRTNWVLYLVTTPAGFILFIVSLVKIWKIRFRSIS